MSWQRVCTLDTSDRSRYVIAVTPAHRASSKVPAGNTAYDPSQAKHPLFYNSSKSVDVLGVKYRTIEESSIDTVKDFETKGWL